MRPDLPLHPKRRPACAQFAKARDASTVRIGVMSVQDENRPRTRSGHMLQQLLAELRQIDHCPIPDLQPNPDHRRVWPLPPLDDPAYPAVSRV